MVQQLKKIKYSLRKQVYKVYPLLACKQRYYWTYGEKINLKDPKTLDEKNIWLMYNRYIKDQTIIDLIDKTKLYEIYSRDPMAKVYLNQLYGIYDKTSDIIWDELPNSFAIKCGHGCGMNIFVKDKSSADKEKIFEQLNAWLRRKETTEFGAIQYNKIKPRIVCERFLDTKDGKPPIDYKMYCCNGKLEAVEVIMDRFDSYHYVLVDRDFKNLPYGKDSIEDETLINSITPIHWNDFIDAAEYLAHPYPYVRVDLYDYHDKPLIGEMTFFPMDGVNGFFEKRGQIELGQKVDIHYGE